MMEHKHAALLRMAADNADQLFYCEINNGQQLSIEHVLTYPEYNWRPVKTTKKSKRWLWADKNGGITSDMYSDSEIKAKWWADGYKIKLLWSETEFEEEV